MLPLVLFLLLILALLRHAFGHEGLKGHVVTLLLGIAFGLELLEVCCLKNKDKLTR